MNDRRRDPDTLLDKVVNEEARRHQGRLKVFFGAAPGVGKTFAMLEAARNKRASGADVVVGWVETHGRAETAALLDGLPRLAAYDLEYRGVHLQEFDLDGALARHPQLLLLDELAHTNVPGSRHAKRWQDVIELLDAGIDVYSTLNVQHVESLNDLVQQITGIAVRETVPDHVLDRADDVEFVDLAPEDLLRRLSDGKVYVPEQAGRAMQQFFRKGNLIALRELALRRTADRVDAQMQDYRRDHSIDRTWPIAERILVCIRPNPESDRLVRAASRMAARLRAEWIVAHVETPAQPPLSRTERESLVATLKLAEQLGATTTVLSGSSVSAALMEHARERNVSKIVVGKPAHSRWLDRLRGSLLDEIVRESGEVDVYFISGDAKERRAFPPRPSARRSSPSNYGRAVATVVLCTLICRPMFEHFDRSNLVMIYLLGVAFVATRYGRGPSALAACLSVGLFDFFFVPPYLTFAVSDSQYVVTFTVMLLVSLLISNLAVRVKDQAEAARQRERRTQTLYAMSRELTSLATPDEIARVTSRHVGELFRGKAVVLLPETSGALVARSTDEVALDAHELSVAQWALEHGQPAGLGTDTLPGAAGLYVPLRGAERALGVLGVRPTAELLPLSPDQIDVLETFCGQAAAALERTRLVHESAQSRVTAERERLRSTLLSSLSHDLRTPLAAITGAATSLRHAPSLAEPVRQELVQGICEEAERLNRLSSNLLDMTRLESASLPLRKEWHSLEEIVGSALSHLDRALEGRAVETSLPPDLPLVPVDAILIEQVLVNLLENAIKYTDPGTSIRIAAEASAGEVVVEVSDAGPGLPPGEEEHVFEKFYRAGPQRSGFGLGLAICRAILTAHGGRIEAENRAPHGTTFRFHLPVTGTPPASPKLSESANEES